MNTRNAFHGLEENLSVLAKKYSPPSLNFTKQKSLLEEDAYFKDNLPPNYGKEPSGLIPINEDETVLGLYRCRNLDIVYFYFSTLYGKEVD